MRSPEQLERDASRESLFEFVSQAIFVRRSLRGWRDLRPTSWEIIRSVLYLVGIAIFLWIMVSDAITSQCLWNRSGPKCDGWMNPKGR